jgi:general secretion pathway protein E
MAKAEEADINRLDLNASQIQPEAVSLIPEQIARQHKVMPIAITDSCLRVAMSNADDILAQEAMAALTRLKIEVVTAAEEDIQQAIDRSYGAHNEIEEFLKGVASSMPVTPVKAPTESASSAPIVRALDLIIDEAVKARASDIHVEPEKDKLRVRFRIDGVLHETMTLPLSAQAPLISRLKILGNMNIADHRPQDGQFSVKSRRKEIDVRVATLATVCGEMATLRILDKSFAALSLDELGFSKDNLERYQNMLKLPFGMVLVSGPTGSGKTTTLYASLNSLDRHGRHIVTIEDPVEYSFKNINQIQVNFRAGLTFAAGLRSIMRHDPNVIMVGEIRDPETAEIAVQAALTGHLVLASIHANDTVGALSRLIDLQVQPFLVSSALVGVVAQRMVRRICSHCRHTYHALMEAQIAYKEELGEERSEFAHGKGCNFCAHTGYHGRIAVFEVMRMSDEIRRLLLSGADTSLMSVQARQDGLVTMRRDGMLKVKDDITTPDEVMREVFTAG